MLYLDYAKPVGGGYILNFFADSEKDIEEISNGKKFVTLNGTDYGVPMDSSTVVITMPDKTKKTFVMEDGEFVESGAKTKKYLLAGDPTVDFSLRCISTAGGSVGEGLPYDAFANTPIMLFSLDKATGVYTSLSKVPPEYLKRGWDWINLLRIVNGGEIEITLWDLKDDPISISDPESETYVEGYITRVDFKKIYTLKKPQNSLTYRCKVIGGNGYVEEDPLKSSFQIAIVNKECENTYEELKGLASSEKVELKNLQFAVVNISRREELIAAQYFTTNDQLQSPIMTMYIVE